MFAPLTIIAGLPGAGKTLFAVSRLREMAAKEGAQVYHCNLDECKVEGWKHLENPHDWFKLPAGSVLIVDEAHKFFPQRGPSMPVPVSVQNMAEVRKFAVRLVLITQDCNGLDHFIRRRAGAYLHFWRPFFLARSVVWQFPEFCDWKDPKSRLNGQTFNFRHDPKAYALYKSAQLHTAKRSIPKKFLLLPVAVVALLACIWWVYKTLWVDVHDNAAKGGQKVAAVASAPAPGVSPLSGGAIPQAGANRPSGPVSAEEYIKARIPRFADLPESAPVYDKLASPKVFPVVAACVRSASRCVCYSQQGTRLSSVSSQTCRTFVASGAFDPYRQAGGMGAAAPHVGQNLRHADPQASVQASAPVSYPIPAEPGFAVSELVSPGAGKGAQRPPPGL